MHVTIPSSQPWHLPPARPQPRASAESKSSLQLIKKTFAAWIADNCMRLAAALACYAVLSLAPLAVITFKIISLILQGPKARAIITSQLQSLMGAAANSDLMDAILKSSHQKSGQLATIISIIILISSASGVFGELQSSMNLIWGVEPKPGHGLKTFFRARFRSMTMVLGLGFLLLVSFFASALISLAAHWMTGGAQFLGVALDLVVSTAIIALTLAMIYRFIPDALISWREVGLGALATAILFTAGKWGLTLYFKYAAPASAYGAFGSLAAVVIWVYYSAQILFLGAEFTKVYSGASGHPIRPRPDAQPVTADCTFPAKSSASSLPTAQPSPQQP